MQIDPEKYEMTNDELLTEIRTLHFEMSEMQCRLISAFDLITELSELVEDTNAYMAESIEQIYAQSTRQARLRDEMKKKKTK